MATRRLAARNSSSSSARATARKRRRRRARRTRLRSKGARRRTIHRPRGQRRGWRLAGRVDLALEQGASHGAPRMPLRHDGAEPGAGGLGGRVIHRPCTAVLSNLLITSPPTAAGGGRPRGVGRPRRWCTAKCARGWRGCASRGRARSRPTRPGAPSPRPRAGAEACDRASAAASDRQALATLGAPRVDDGAAAARLHADEKAVGAGAADLGGLVGAFHGLPGVRVRRGRKACGGMAPVRATRDYSKKRPAASTTWTSPAAVATPSPHRVFSTVDNSRFRPRLGDVQCRGFHGNFSTHARRPLATRLRAPRRRAARPAIQHLDPAAARRRGHRPRRRRRDGDVAARAQPLQARLDPHPVRRPDRDRAERAGRQAGAPRPHARAARRRRAGPARRRAAGAGAPVARAVRGRGRLGRGPPSTAPPSPVPPTPATLPSRSRLNPALTFDTLVPGRANQMARTAALHVAGAPGADVQPAVHLRRRRPRQDAPDPRRRQRAAAPTGPTPASSICTPSSSSPTW